MLMEYSIKSLILQGVVLTYVVNIFTNFESYIVSSNISGFMFGTIGN